MAAHGGYTDPHTGPCGPGALNVTLPDVAGAFCAPPCAPGGHCEVPAGARAPVQAECALEVNGAPVATYCALVCSPGRGGGGCPVGSVCSGVSVGVCTYMWSPPVE